MTFGVDVYTVPDNGVFLQLEGGMDVMFRHQTKTLVYCDATFPVCQASALKRVLPTVPAVNRQNVLI